MISLETACKSAVQYFKKEYGFTRIGTIKDCGDKYFIAGLSDETIYGGNTCIFISKENGQRYDVLDDFEIYEAIDKSPDVDILPEYR